MQVSVAKNSNMYIMVAFGHQRQRFTRQLAFADQVIWCPDVYDAVATAVQALSTSQGQTVCVLLDSLIRNDLQIFSCLGRFGPIKTIAVSSIASQHKSNQARLLGADIVLSLQEFTRLLSNDSLVGVVQNESLETSNASKYCSLDDLLVEGTQTPATGNVPLTGAALSGNTTAEEMEAPGQGGANLDTYVKSSFSHSQSASKKMSETGPPKTYDAGVNLTKEEMDTLLGRD
ncbi:MAG: hypothetical protein K9M57_08335 [Phycisphaerae bacterium]|nr:hypothetical protein [Phycisphaerae bacterium]